MFVVGSGFYAIYFLFSFPVFLRSVGQSAGSAIPVDDVFVSGWTSARATAGR